MPELTDLYASVADLREFGNINLAQADSAQAGSALLVASRWADEETNQRKYGFTTSVVGAQEVVQAPLGPVLGLPEYLVDINAVTQITVEQVVIDPTTYEVDTRSAVLLRFGGSWWGRCIITATWGWSYVPVAVKRATALYAAGLVVEGSDAEALTMRSISTTPEGQAPQFKAAAKRYMDHAAELLQPFKVPAII